MPFLLRCWLITSIGEDPTPVRSRWAKKKPRLHEVCRRGVSMNELYLKEDFPSFSDSYIHFAGSLISSESGLKSTVSRGISKVLP